MRVAILGIGRMGEAMAKRLTQCGHTLTVYNRTQWKTRRLADLGISVALDPLEALDWATCTILTLTDARAILEVLFKPTVSRPDLTGRTLIQMGTISPDESVSIEKAVNREGGEYLEAPVLGSTPEAEAGNLSVMVGADSARYQTWRELLGCFSPRPRHIGPVGQASALKLALNHLIVSMTTSFSYSLGIVLRRGIDLNEFMDVLRESPLYAKQFDKKLGAILERDFSSAHFPTRHMLKDVQLILAEGKSLGLETHLMEAVRTVVQKAVEGGWAESDYASLYNAVNPP